MCIRDSLGTAAAPQGPLEDPAQQPRPLGRELPQELQADRGVWRSHQPIGVPGSGLRCLPPSSFL
eukprot:8095211-Alexandrium_andersonii.AAC.1